MASFTLDVARFVEKAQRNADEVFRKVGMDVLERLVFRSPVGNPSLWKNPAPPGYVGGRFRANWMVAVNVQPRGTTPAIDPSGTATIAQGSQAIGGAHAGDVIYVVNNLPYAWRIETGWSTQAPTGVVGITVTEFQSLVSKAASEVAK